LDLTGQTLVAVALLGVVWVIIEAGPSGWHSPLVLSGIILAVTSGIAFIIVERKASDPAVPIDLFRNMEVSTTMLVGFAVHSLMIGVTFGFALYFQRVLSFSTVETGIAFLPFGLMVIAANVAGGRCVARFGLRGPMCIGLVIAATGCAVLLGIDRDTTYLAILPGQLLIRLGIGLVVPAITTGMLAAVPSARSGVASGALNATRQTGGAVGVAMFGALMTSDIVQGIRIALVISGLLLLLTAIIGLAGMRVAPAHDAERGRRVSGGRSLPSSVR
jgi:DHA2 family methylenomycin A resistance protein-like MFS transporter